MTQKTLHKTPHPWRYYSSVLFGVTNHSKVDSCRRVPPDSARPISGESTNARMPANLWPFHSLAISLTRDSASQSPTEYYARGTSFNQSGRPCLPELLGLLRNLVEPIFRLAGLSFDPATELRLVKWLRRLIQRRQRSDRSFLLDSTAGDRFRYGWPMTSCHPLPQNGKAANCNQHEDDRPIGPFTY